MSAGGVLLEHICLGSSSNWSISAPGVLAGVCWDFDWSSQTPVSEKFCIKQNTGLTDISNSQTDSSANLQVWWRCHHSWGNVDWYKMWSWTKISNDMPSVPNSNHLDYCLRCENRNVNTNATIAISLSYPSEVQSKALSFVYSAVRCMYYDPIVKQSQIRLIQDWSRGMWAEKSITVFQLIKIMTKSIIKQVLRLKKNDVNLGRGPILKSELSIFARRW